MYVIAMPEEKKLLPKNADFLITGVGALNVINKLNNINRNIEIINIGYAGSNLIPIGSKVEIGKVALYHPNVDYDSPEYLLNGNVSCFTSCDFVMHTDIEYPCVFDMELAFILALGFKNVKAIKIVSDNLNINQFERSKLWQDQELK